MKRLMTPQTLRLENDASEHAEEFAALGFQPAFLDFSTLRIYPSCFPDGRPAMVHLLDGLPEEVVVMRSPCGKVLAAKMTLIPGFVRHGYFYTRALAARVAADWPS